MEQTHDQQRLGSVETDVGILKSTDLAFAKLLDGIATTLKELKASSYPPFSDVVRTFGSGVLTASILLGGFFYLTNAQIDNKTAQLHDRVAKLEAAISWQASFVSTASK